MTIILILNNMPQEPLDNSKEIKLKGESTTAPVIGKGTPGKTLPEKNTCIF